MNIFVTDIDPIISAQNLCNEHVRSKMQIESAIMLAHAFPQSILNHESTPRTKTGKPRKTGKGYYNHQCSVWARQSKDNFMWLADHALEMFVERMYRWPSSNEHFTKEFIVWCKNNVHNTTINSEPLTEFAVAINDSSNCRLIPEFYKLSVIEQYRLFISYDKPFATWTGRDKPSWYSSEPLHFHPLYTPNRHQLERQAA
jgi:hypothetical protein